MASRDQDLVDRLIRRIGNLPPGPERDRAQQELQEVLGYSHGRPPGAPPEYVARPEISAITLRDEVTTQVRKDMNENLAPMLSMWALITGALVMVVLTVWLLLHLFWFLGFNHLLTGH